MNKVFETFDIRQKMEELDTGSFTGENIAIIVPTLTFDESHRLIEESDEVLCQAQKRDASILLHYISSKQKQGSVCIIRDGDEANEMTRRFDFVIFLHKFNPYEQEYVLIGLCENNKNLRIIEMY